ncbi:WD repeat-containing protein 36 [Lamellibrachia satsuma]|nr:WD repeat-containing protein 36 [Lamellibrachia satsuma]
MDSTVRTWDLPSGRLVDCFLVDSAVTSLALSPTADFLATTHVDDLGIYLWSNMTLYTHVALRPLAADFEPQLMDVPATNLRSQGVNEEPEDKHEREQYVASHFKSPEQISNELVTLSLLPRSRWHSLLNLDVIKQRNKPKQPPKVPKAAPFFLPTVPGLELTFAKLTDDVKEDKVSSHTVIQHLLPLSKFAQLLHDSNDASGYGAAVEKLKGLGPSAIDAELRQLGPDAGGSVELLVGFLHMLNDHLETNRDFELMQAYLALFLKLHGDVITLEPALVEAAGKLQEAQGSTWRRLEELFNQNLCLANYFKSAVL